MRYAIVTETYPPEVNGVALTVQGLEQGLRQAVERGMLIASIGPTCTEALQDQGFPVHAEASPPKMGQLARAAVEAWAGLGASMRTL